MKDYDDKTLEKIEKQIKAEFDAIELEPAEETLAAIRPRLKKKQKRTIFKHHPFSTRVIAIAASIILLFGIGLTVWLTWPKDSEYRYEDGIDIEKKNCEKADIINYPELYIPDLDILTMNIIYMVGEHTESLEKVYFIIEGMNIDNGIMRNITLTIILQEKYLIDKEEKYNSDNKITVSGIEISYLEEDYLEPFYNYKIGFKIGNVRYYMDYQTTSTENDIESFMQLFLK